MFCCFSFSFSYAYVLFCIVLLLLFVSILPSSSSSSTCPGFSTSVLNSIPLSIIPSFLHFPSIHLSCFEIFACFSTTPRSVRFLRRLSIVWVAGVGGVLGDWPYDPMTLNKRDDEISQAFRKTFRRFFGVGFGVYLVVWNYVLKLCLKLCVKYCVYEIAYPLI